MTADDDAPDLPEPEPAAPKHPGLASWAERRHGGPPPYEESDEQADARRRVRGEADPDLYERRRKRLARIARRREERRCPLPAPGDAPDPRPDPRA